MTPQEVLNDPDRYEGVRISVCGTIGLWGSRCSIYEPNTPTHGFEQQEKAFRSGIPIAMPGLRYSLSVSGRMTYGGIGQVRLAEVLGRLKRFDVDTFHWVLSDIESVSLVQDLNSSGLPSPLVLTPEDVRYAVECRLKNLESVSSGPDWDKKVAEQRIALSSW